MKHKWRMDNGVPDEWAWESGFHNGVYCERCGKAVCVHCQPDWEEMDDCEKYEREPQTNADRIRAMSDEELAELLCTDHCVQIRGNNKLCDGTCFDCVADWLKQPAKGGDNDG